jgi:uncharacterized delta-60 repeat protein
MSWTSWLRNWRTASPPTRVHRPGGSPRRTSLRLEQLADRCLLSGGVLDPTFGNGGLAITPPLGTLSSGNANAVAVDPTNGTIVAAGTADDGTHNSNNYDFKVVRFTSNGSLDPAFGGSGMVTTSFGSDEDFAFDVGIQPLDHRIVAAGTSRHSGNIDFALVRYNTDGTLDGMFGSNGKVTTNFTGKGQTASLDSASAMVLQTDGKIVLAGITVSTISRENNIGIARYNTNGSLDANFGSGGKVITNYTSIPGSVGYTQVNDMALEPDGKIVVVGATEFSGGPNPVYHAFVARYTTTGSLDITFGGTGIETLAQITDSGTWAGRTVAIQPSDGRIIVAWTEGSADVLVRYNLDGSLDSTFGSNGIAVATIGQFISSIAFQPSDGKIVLAGNQVTSPYTTTFSVARFQATGGLDTAFGNSGIATTPTSFQAAASIGPTLAFDAGAHAGAYDVAIQPDGKIVLAGAGSISGSPGGLALARFLAAGPQIGSFTASPNPISAGSTLTLTASNISDVNPRASISQVAFYVDSNADGVLEPGTDTLLGYATQTSPGVWTFNFSTSGMTSGTYTFFAVAQDSYGVFSDPFAISDQVI